MPDLSIVPLDYDAQLGVITYFHSRTDAQLDRMGCDRACLPDPAVWRDRLFMQARLPVTERSLYYVGWYADGRLFGHANINDAAYGGDALTHMHMWDAGMSGKGYGPRLMALSLRHFFTIFRLRQIICEPKADNSGPNGVFRQLGIPVKKTYETKPGPMNVFQSVNRYEISPADVGL